MAVTLISLRYAIRTKVQLPARGAKPKAAESPASNRRSVALTGAAAVAAAILVVAAIPSQKYTSLETEDVLTVAASAHTVERIDFKPHPTPEEVIRNWPRFRGPSGLGIAASEDFPQDGDGPAGAGVLWKTEIPLHGNSSPIVWGDRVFITGADENRREVYCYDIDTGSMLWNQQIAGNAGVPEVTDDTGYSASTPATDGRLVYAIFAAGDIAAIDFEGRLVWSRTFAPLDNAYGHASSLEVWKNLVFVQLDQGHSAGDGKSMLYALNAETGNTVWQVQRPVQGSWTSPAVFSTPSGDQLITVAAPYVISYDPATGSELWRAECMSGDAAPSPVYAGGKVYVCQEYARVAAIATDGRGDVTETHILWSGYDGLPDIVSPLTDGELLYLVNSYGLVTCLDASNGETVWEHYFDVEFKASPVLAGRLVYLLDTDGVMHVFENAREFRLVATAELGETVHATPAFLNGRIYLRGERHLYCIATGQNVGAGPRARPSVQD